MFQQIKFKHQRRTFAVVFVGIIAFQMMVNQVGFAAPLDREVDQHVDTLDADKASQFSVEVFGQSKEAAQSVILIPGLMSDGRVWHNLVSALSANYQVHVVNVAGFGKTPSIATPKLAAVKDQLLEYINAKQLKKPAVIGHSLGGFMAFWLASERPEKIGSVISVDGLPFIGPVFTRSNSTSVQSLAAQAAQIRTMYAAMSSEQLTAQAQYGLHIQASHDEGKALIMDMIAASAPTAVAEAMFSLMSTDLRENIAKIQSPTLLLGAAGGYPQQIQKDQMKALYMEQLSALSEGQVVMHNKARHFIMLDDPTWLNQQVTNFLQQNKAVASL